MRTSENSEIKTTDRETSDTESSAVSNGKIADVENHGAESSAILHKEEIQSQIPELMFLWIQLCEVEHIINIPELLEVEFNETLEPTFETQTKDFYIWECAYEVRKTRLYYERPKLFVGYKYPKIMHTEETDYKIEDSATSLQQRKKSSITQKDKRKKTITSDDSLVTGNGEKHEDKEIGKAISLDVQGRVEGMPLIRAICRLFTVLAESLKVLKLIDCSLTSPVISGLAVGLKREPCIQYLYLDRNPNNYEQNFYEVINNFSLKHLSLKYCDINDEGARNLAKKISWLSVPKQYLVSLDLTGNNISSKGAKSFAEALRWNRTLKRLILIGNKIKNSGAKELASVFHAFDLTKKEIQLRQTRFWKRQNIINICLSENMDSGIQNILKSWMLDRSHNAKVYNDYQEKLQDFRVICEMRELFGRDFVSTMESFSKYKYRNVYDGKMESLQKLLSDEDRAARGISSEVNSSDAGSYSYGSTHFPKLFREKVYEKEDSPKRDQDPDKGPASSMDNSSKRKILKTREELEKLLVEKIRRKVEKDLEPSENSPIEYGDEIDEILNPSKLPNCKGNPFSLKKTYGVRKEESSVATTSGITETVTWSSFGMFPGKIAFGNELDGLSPEGLNKVYYGIKQMIEYINSPDVMKGEMYEHEVCMIFKKLWEDADAIVPEDLHPLMKDVGEKDSQSWCCGNYIMKHLNISYNRIGKKGFESFLQAFLNRNMNNDLHKMEFIYEGNRLDKDDPLNLELNSEIVTWPHIEEIQVNLEEEEIKVNGKNKRRKTQRKTSKK